MLKKILLVVLSLGLFLNSLFLPAITLAQTPTPTIVPSTTTGSWYNQTFADWYIKVYDTKNPSEIFGERYTAAQVQWILYSLPSIVINWLGQENQEFTTCSMGVMGSSIDIGTCFKAYWNTTFLKKALDLLNLASVPDKTPLATVLDFSNRDVSGIKYVYDSLSKFGLVNEVNAQNSGFGYAHLGIMQPFWTLSRNFAYTVMVLFVIIFAFMIMFRVKISPQIVISVQSALPKIISVLILATFSYAIAGFVVDLMYVVMGIIAGFLSPLSMSLGFRYIYAFISGTGIAITGGGAAVTSPLLIFAYMLTYTILFFVLILVTAIASISTTLSVFAVLLSVLMLLLVVWLLILCLWYTIKIPWILIKALISIYMSVAIAPIQIAFGAIAPQAGFGQWLKSLIANVMVFPFVGTMLFFAYIFLGYGYMTVAETIIERSITSEIVRAFGFNNEGFILGNLWSPPFLGSGAEITPLLFALMSFGMIVAIPKATEILKMLVMGEKFSYGSAIGEAIGPAKWAWGQTGGQLAGVLGKVRADEAYRNASNWVWGKVGLKNKEDLAKRGAHAIGFRQPEQIEETLRSVSSLSDRVRVKLGYFV